MVTGRVKFKLDLRKFGRELRAEPIQKKKRERERGRERGRERKRDTERV